MAKRKATPLTKFLGIFAIIGALGFGMHMLGVFDGSFAEQHGGDAAVTSSSSSSTSSNGGNYKNTTGKTIKIGVVTWGGYAAGQYWNQGFTPNKNSFFRRDYGFDVEFKVLDDFVPSRDAWKSGDIDLLWATVDAFPTEAGSLPDEPQLVFQADWSRGGDAIVVRQGISTVADLKGKKVAVALLTPSHSFLINMVNASNLSMNDFEIVEVASAIDAAAMFKSNNVDAAVVWSPDDADCLEASPGSKVLASTKEASNIIADGFFAKKSWITANQDILQQLYEGWMKGAATLNTNSGAREQAAQILAEGLNVDLDFATLALNNVRFTTHGDNVNFFGLNRSFSGVTGEDLFSKMGAQYQSLGFIDRVPRWRNHNYTGAIKNTMLDGSNHDAEETASFAAVTEQEVQNATAVASKAVTITFRTGESTLDENAKYIINTQFLDVAKQFANQRIRVAGNTDNTGSAAVNKRISKARAQSVVDYLVNERGFDPNRFIVVGNGPDNPVASNATKDGRAQNRRTDFELIQS